jgi:triosephosphate isomerase (TIM)
MWVNRFERGLTLYKEIRLAPPIFEIGLKGYLYGAAAVRLAIEADRASREFGISVIFDPQAVDIAAVVRETQNLYVFAQHMDPVEIGRGNGSVLPEAIKEAGAVGAMINHSERRMTLNEIRRAVRRADQVGLATLVCTDSPEEAAAVAQFRPNIVLSEPPELIGGNRSVATEMRDFVERTKELVAAIDPEIIVMCAAGIKTPRDVEVMVELGVGGTGSTSGILKAEDPVAQMRAMLAAMRAAWDRRHPST